MAAAAGRADDAPSRTVPGPAVLSAARGQAVGGRRPGPWCESGPVCPGAGRRWASTGSAVRVGTGLPGGMPSVGIGRVREGRTDVGCCRLGYRSVGMPNGMRLMDSDWDCRKWEGETAEGDGRRDFAK